MFLRLYLFLVLVHFMEKLLINASVFVSEASMESDQKTGVLWELKHDYLKFEDCISICLCLLILLSFSCFQALSKALTEDELVYLRAQFKLLEPGRDGSVSLDSFKMVFTVCFLLIQAFIQLFIYNLNSSFTLFPGMTWSFS